MSVITVRITGDGMRRFKGFGPRMERELDKTLTKIVYLLKGESQKLVEQGPFRTGKPRRDGSIASAPGEPAKTDDGDLARSISVSISQRLVKRVGTFIKHGIFMEEGTRNIFERPYLRPTIGANKNRIIKLIENTINMTP